MDQNISRLESLNRLNIREKRASILSSIEFYLDYVTVTKLLVHG